MKNTPNFAKASLGTQKGFAPILLILLALAVIGGGVYFYTEINKPRINDSQLFNKGSFNSQQECESVSGRVCGYNTCDYIPEGKTFEEVCGKDYKGGWKPFSTYVSLSVNTQSSFALILVNEDGSSFYKESGKNNEEKIVEGLVDQSKFEELMQWITNRKFFERKEQAPVSNDSIHEDLFKIDIVLPVKDANNLFSTKTYTIQCYESLCSPDFLELKKKIISLWGKDVLDELVS